MELDRMHYDFLRDQYNTDSGRIITSQEMCATTVEEEVEREPYQICQKESGTDADSAGPTVPDH